MLRVGISLALLVFLFSRLDIDIARLLDILKHADQKLLWLALLTFVAINFVCIMRWYQLLRSVDIRLPFRRVLISFAGGIFFNVFTPSTIGGDFVRSLDLAAYTKKTKEVVATVFLDRLSGYIGLVIVALVSVACGWRLIKFPSILISLIVITAALVVILLLLFNQPVYRAIKHFLDAPHLDSRQHPKQGTGGRRWAAPVVLRRLRVMLGNLHSEIHLFRDKKGLIAKNIFLSLIIQFLSPLTFYFTALALGMKIDLLYFFIFVPVISAITMLPISIGGLGVRDNAAALFFGKVGMSHDFAVAMSLLNFVYILIVACAGGIIYVFTVYHRRIQSHPSSSL